jgi:hypothetical protein
MNFNFQVPSMFAYIVFTTKKMVLLNVVHPLRIYQHTNIHGPTQIIVKFHIHL